MGFQRQKPSSSARRQRATSHCLQQIWPSTLREFLERAEFNVCPQASREITAVWQHKT
jgi:hypothetical protein